MYDYYLNCRYDSRKSFYGKAKVEVKESPTKRLFKLYSYGTLVATVEEDRISGEMRYNSLGYYSQTSARHQREFFLQKGLDVGNTNMITKKGSNAETVIIL